ncbi:4-amino-4-deoxy-L-arabinose transferase of PMT family protein [Nostoc sp. NIES-3756]|uniref:glycosyltransferase family 39 protein n=1 Tax=Nostoc sp. NIES-3756 TaxID=1751286 RepID=UPI0007206B91|nr:glycosyltransferase family 39 protein [Nostoc sp. NIES-3756]BAT55820.1 4-amino-4-deoxy-L-arabinose transferase of PMT family protein [Nostoc sp. NIES-3756]
MKISRSFYLLIAILMVAAILRLQHINQPFDDAFSWRQSSTAMMAENFYRRNWNIFYPEVSWHGPGTSYNGREFQTVSYIAALLYIPFGQHDWIGRLIPVIFGLWGIFALYQLVRRVWDEEHALASATMIAILPGSIFIERSFLPDPAMVSLMTTSFWMLVVYVQTERFRYLMLASAIAIWGLLTKIPGLIVGIPMLYAVLTIFASRRVLNYKKLVIIGLAGVITLLPVLIYYLWARHLALSYPPYHFAGSGNWLWHQGLDKWWEQQYFFPLLSQRFRGWMWTLPVIILVVFGLLCKPPKKANKDKAPWLFHWWLLGGILYYIIGAKELVDNPWNFHIINPAAAALAGHGIIVITSCASHIFGSPASSLLAGLIILLIGKVGMSSLNSMYMPYANDSYKLGLALRQLSQPQELVLTMANDLGDPIPIYYSRRRGWVFPPAQKDQSWAELPQDDTQSIQLFENLRVEGADLFGVVNNQLQELWQNHLKFMQYIERTCQREQENGEFVIYRILKQKKSSSAHE